MLGHCGALCSRSQTCHQTEHARGHKHLVDVHVCVFCSHVDKIQIYKQTHIMINKS